MTAQDPAALYRQAERKYAARQFDSAAALLENLVRQGYSSAAIHRNLANNYAQRQKTGLAVLHYEKARLLAPRDTAIARNLQQLRQKNGLSVPAESPLARLVARISPDTVAWLAVACLFGGMVCLLAVVWLGYKIMWADDMDLDTDNDPGHDPDGKAERASVWLMRAGCLLLALGIALLGAGLLVRQYRKANRTHVVIAAAQGRYAPSPNARELARLPEGSLVAETDAFAGWLKVRLTDGRQVWIGRRHVAAVCP